MHVKRIHSMLESLTECAESALKNDQTHVGKYPISEVIDMIKDLSEAEYHSKITHAMDEEKEEEEKQDEYALMRMKEEYGEDDGQRYYNEWRYANGRYAPRGRGSRRGYTVPVRYLISPKSGYMSPEEYERDMDRWDKDRMYYAGQGGNSSSSGNSSNFSGNMSDSSGSNSNSSSMRSYEDGRNRGYEDGNRDGYERGYSEGERRGRSMNQRDSREGRSGQSRRSYIETKEMNTSNTPESKQEKMRKLEEYTAELKNDVSQMMENSTNEEKTLLKNRLTNMAASIM